MKERPILFSAPMVRAILDGKKTQTRRVIKPSKHGQKIHHDHGAVWLNGFTGWESLEQAVLDGALRCPYGQPGNRLWVRETFMLKDGMAIYRACDAQVEWAEMYGGPWKPSIYMPRWASRITLEVTGIRVERVQDISEEDAELEGIDCVDSYDAYGNAGKYFGVPGYWAHERASDSFHELWDTINAKRGYGWDSNPWVWVVSFLRVEP